MGNSSSKADSCKIHYNADRKGICNGCNKIEALLNYQSTHQKLSAPMPFHRDFMELDECAQECVACKIFRQALLLKQLTPQDEQSLMASGDGIYATTRDSTLTISSGRTDYLSKCALLTLMPSQEIAHITRPEHPHENAIFDQVQEWLAECKKLHRAECGNLGWSRRKPTRLIRILSDEALQLIDTENNGGMLIPASEMEYVALSYRWGKGSGGLTTDENLRFRRHSFHIGELPATSQDAIKFARRVGLQFVWIDAVCIVQGGDGSDFRREAPRMHEVYGNATFTICASSNEAATQPLLQTRRAWSFRTEPVRLNGHWIVNFDGSLDEMRRRSPLSTRAWTLQEEFLSPRILYWFGQRMYWSCAKSQHMEMNVSHRSGALTMQQSSQTRRKQNSPQEFLTCCWNGDLQRLHQEWLTIVVSYARRDLTRAEDRFKALSGVASRYLRTQMSGASYTDAYVAGLWRTTFTQDLAWTVVQDRHEDGHLQSYAPTWSWASLPLCTEISHLQERHFIEQCDFHLLQVLSKTESRTKKEGPPSAVEEAIEAGAHVQSVQVSGRFRPFTLQHSRSRDWNDLQVGSLDERKFYFDQPEEATHSQHLETRWILSYEPGKEAIVGQLDYVPDKEHVNMEDLYCLEISKSVMLILRLVGSGNEGKWRRVGLAWDYRLNFFSGYHLESLNLV